jgi:gluconolactonase
MSVVRGLAWILLALSHAAGAATPVARIERLDRRLDAIVAADAVVDLAVDGIEWAEGPLWDARNRSLLFSDVPRNAIFRWMPGQPPVIELDRSGYNGEVPYQGREPGSNGLTFDTQGRLVFCRHGDRSIARRDGSGNVTTLASAYHGRRLNSPNDLVYGPNGDLYFTDPPFGLPQTFKDPGRELTVQGVYRLSADGRVRLVIADLDAPNGIGFSPDGRTLYVSNAFNERPVWFAYDVNRDGSVQRAREFANARAYVAPGEGVPDGLKIDLYGNVFAAGPGGVHIFAPDGSRLGRIITDVPTGNVAWGEDGRTLFIAANHRILRLRVLSGSRVR